MNNYINSIKKSNSLEELQKIKDNSIDLVLTDPPYFLDKLDNNWNTNIINSTNNYNVIKSLPAGMKFNKNKGKEFYNWYIKISINILRILKPGGYFFSFSSPRLYHRMACAVEDAGFDIRDCFIWLYTQNQPKAMSLKHFINKMDISSNEKLELIKKIEGWKTPQVKSCFEPICMAQKPVEKTYLNNF